MIQPLPFSSSRKASVRLKSLAFRAASALLQQGQESARQLPLFRSGANPKTATIFSHAANPAAACSGRIWPDAASRLFSRTHSKIAPQAAETLKSSSSAAVNWRSRFSSGGAVALPAGFAQFAQAFVQAAQGRARRLAGRQA